MAGVKASKEGLARIEEVAGEKGWDKTECVEPSIEASLIRLFQRLEEKRWTLKRQLKDSEIKSLGIFDTNKLKKIIELIPIRSRKTYQDIEDLIKAEEIIAQNCSLPSWHRLLKREAIRREGFQAFCEALGLNWEEVVEQEEETSERQETTLEAVIAKHTLPSLPPSLLPRSDELEKLKRKVLARTGETIVMTGTAYRVGVRGMGGIGKSVLATMLAHDSEIKQAFPDGVLWLTFGQEPNLKFRQSDLAKMLGDTSPLFQDEQQGKVHLSQLFADKAYLLILDDVWESQHIKPFNLLDSRSCLLVTTRNKQLVHDIDAVEHEISLLSESQAISLLALRAGDHQENLPAEAYEVAQECGYLPLALAMIGAMVKGKPDRWNNVLQKLRNADLEKIKATFPDYEYPSLFKAIQVSVEALEPEIQARYLDFAVFPENTPIPEATLQTFWQPQGLDQYDTQDVLDEIVALSLAQRDQKGYIRLHDLQYDYVRKQITDLPGLHNQLLNAYSQECAKGWHSGKNDGYFFENLAYHLKQAGRNEELYQLLTSSPDWMEAKFIACQGDAGYLADLDLAINDFVDPLTPERIFVLAQLHTAKQLVKERKDLYNDDDLKTLVWLRREKEAINYAYLGKKDCEKARSLLSIHQELYKLGVPNKNILKNAWQLVNREPNAEECRGNYSCFDENIKIIDILVDIEVENLIFGNETTFKALGLAHKTISSTKKILESDVFENTIFLNKDAYNIKFAYPFLKVFTKFVVIARKFNYIQHENYQGYVKEVLEMCSLFKEQSFINLIVLSDYGFYLYQNGYEEESLIILEMISDMINPHLHKLFPSLYLDMVIALFNKFMKCNCFGLAQKIFEAFDYLYSGSNDYLTKVYREKLIINRVDALVYIDNIKDAEKYLDQVRDDRIKVQGIKSLAYGFAKKSQEEKAKALFVEGKLMQVKINCDFGSNEQLASKNYALIGIMTALASSGYTEKAQEILKRIDVDKHHAESSLQKSLLPNTYLLDKPAKEMSLEELEKALQDKEMNLDEFLCFLGQQEDGLLLYWSKPNLGLATLKEAVRIAAWIRPDWQEVYEMLPVEIEKKQ